jgi:hypothetical protein
MLNVSHQPPIAGADRIGKAALSGQCLEFSGTAKGLISADLAGFESPIMPKGK